jgi:hypothetical protein
MNIARRLCDLESHLGMAGECSTCSERTIWRAWFPDEAQPAPEPCPTCGRDRLGVIRVNYTQGPINPISKIFTAG